jgi:hypothetical protein
MGTPGRLGKFGVVRRRDIEVRPVQLAVAVALLAAVAGCSANAQPAKVATSPVSASSRKASVSASSPRPSTRQPAPTPTPTKTGPSALPVAPASAASEPQTKAFPKTTDAAFSAEVHDIWLAVTTGNPDYAKPAFFPEKAYLQVKAISNPAADWRDRLWYDFTLDVAAAHKLLGTNATLVKVIVPTQYAQWIPPGYCYNSIGYWHVPGSRVVYRQNGTTKSIGVASFISWRGDWYVVHLGALVRSGAYGIVDNPSQGEGVPGPPGGC